MSETIGCADNSCIFKALRGPGMGTNGGCRCFESLVSWVGDEQTGRWNRDEVKRVERDTRRLRAEVERLREEAGHWQSAFMQKKYPAESCREERDAGNGGCGACSTCCHEARAEVERLRDALVRVLVWEPRSTEAACEQDYGFARAALAGKEDQ